MFVEGQPKYKDSKLVKFQTELLDQFRECMRDAGDALIIQHKLEMEIMRNILTTELHQVKQKLVQVLATCDSNQTKYYASPFGGIPSEHSFCLDTDTNHIH